MRYRKLSYVVAMLAICGWLVGTGYAAAGPDSSPESGQMDASATGATEKSADEIARELANPNNSLATLNFKNQYRWYEGSLPGADSQSNYSLLFQPVFPFSLGETESGGKANLFVRPAIPLLVDQPTFDAGDMSFDGVTAVGDIGFDIGYGVTEKNGLLWSVGMVGQLPTATDSAVAGKEMLLGPELLVAKFEKWGIYGLFPSHLWDVAGWSDEYVSVSQAQAFFILLPGQGLTVGTKPIMSYNWDTSDWTLPLNLAVTKTVVRGKTPWKLGVELNYYVERPDAFGPEWMIEFNIAPVVPNVVERWIKGG